MIRLRTGAGPVLAALAGVAAVAGCLLPWEEVVVRPAGEVHRLSVGSFHGSGLAACIGAALLLLMLADALLRPRPSLVRDAGLAAAGALLAVGAALFTAEGGYPPVSAAAYGVSLQPGLFVAGGVGALLVLRTPAAAAWRRAGSRSPASSA
jgi:hypothetical protein